VENDNVSNNKFLFMAIFLISMSSFCAFLIGYGINSGACPPCKDKTIVKLFTTENNVANDVDYNMLTSEIKKDLVGKYVNQLDKKSYLKIYKDGSFEFVRNSCSQYEKYTNEDYVLLMYYSKKTLDDDVIEETEYEYKNILTLIPKGEIDSDNLTTSMLTFKDSMSTDDGISDMFIGPVTCSTSNVYVKE